MRVVIFGAAGTVGRAVAAELGARHEIISVGRKSGDYQVDLTDLAAVRGELEAAGVAVTPIKQRWGAWVCYCHDPEGHRIELWEET